MNSPIIQVTPEQLCDCYWVKLSSSTALQGEFPILEKKLNSESPISNTYYRPDILQSAEDAKSDSGSNLKDYALLHGK